MGAGNTHAQWALPHLHPARPAPCLTFWISLTHWRAGKQLDLRHRLPFCCLESNLLVVRREHALILSHLIKIPNSFKLKIICVTILPLFDCIFHIHFFKGSCCMVVHFSLVVDDVLWLGSKSIWRLMSVHSSHVSAKTSPAIIPLHSPHVNIDSTSARVIPHPDKLGSNPP